MWTVTWLLKPIGDGASIGRPGHLCPAQLDGMARHRHPLISGDARKLRRLLLIGLGLLMVQIALGEAGHRPIAAWPVALEFPKCLKRVVAAAW